MASIPKRVEDRLAAGVKKYQPILALAKSRDVNESDTVAILNDILGDVFGYEKYFEITSEFSIRGTYCDIAIKLDNQITVLIEAKAIGGELKDAHVKQAIDYAANQGVDWVVLTNAAQWRIYKVVFGKPIDQELVCEFDFLTLDPKDENHLQLLFLLTKEGWAKSSVTEYHEQKQALSRFFVGASILSETVLAAIRRELKRVSPDVRIDVAQIRDVILADVMKREVVEGDKFANAEKALARAATKASGSRKAEDSPPPEPPVVETAAVTAPPVMPASGAPGATDQSRVNT